MNVVTGLAGLRKTALTRSGPVRLKLTKRKAPQERLRQAVGEGNRLVLSRGCGLLVAGRLWHRLERGGDPLKCSPLPLSRRESVLPAIRWRARHQKAC